MAEVLRKLIASFYKKENKKEEKTFGRLQVEMGKRLESRDRNLVRVEGSRRRESGEVGVVNGEFLGLKRKLGLARLEKGQVLLEFELVEEARRVLTSGKRSMGGIQVGLEFWNPRYGCLEKGEIRNEAWVRILGLPISLWVPSIMRRVGEECGGFLAIDPQTERMEELQWARILVKSNGEDLPSSLEIGVEETTYHLPLWGDGGARIGPQVEERVNTRPKAQSRTTNGTEGQVDEAGSDLTEGWIQFGAGGPLLQGPSEGEILKGAGDGGVGPVVGQMGSEGKEKVAVVENGPPFGPSVPLRNRLGPSLTQLKAFGVQPIGPSVLLRDGHGPSKIQPTDKGLSVKPVREGSREKAAGGLPLLIDRPRVSGRRFEVWVLIKFGGLKGLGSTSPSISFSFGQTPEEEFYDHSGAIKEVCQNGNLLMAWFTEGVQLSLSPKKERGKGNLIGKKVA
ncbi:hypothetical protein CK203_038163 [Vitis vinifera]|uniref:Uncharacterized protein n=1 Tax=Vitis vinifera TaxID=29760 RepID=A0A438HA19_VITVI|nr:hypothetical protein CK203_038163 [Vitis vinifera]